MQEGKNAKESLMDEEEMMDDLDFSGESEEEVINPQEDDSFDDEESNEDFGSDEGEDESSDETSEGESQDEEGETTEPQEQKSKQKQSKADNAKFAEKRREQEAIQKRKVDEAYFKGKVDALVGTKNPYTGESMEDEEDVKEFFAMKEAEKAGFDPATELSKWQKQKARDDRKAQQTKDSFDAESDIKLFNERYPDVNLQELIKNEEFTEFAGPFVKKVPMAEIYAQYQLMQKRVESVAQKQAEEKYKRKASSPGAISSPSAKEVSFANMSDKEFEKALLKAERGDLLN